MSSQKSEASRVTLVVAVALATYPSLYFLCIEREVTGHRPADRCVSILDLLIA